MPIIDKLPYSLCSQGDNVTVTVFNKDRHTAKISITKIFQKSFTPKNIIKKKIMMPV
jgi:hypothetical protein